MATGRGKYANAADRAGIGGLVVAGLRGIDSRTLACLQNAFFRSSAHADLHRGSGTALQHDVWQRGADLPAAGAVVAVPVDYRGCRSGAARITEIAQAPRQGRQPAAVAAKAGLTWETIQHWNNNTATEAQRRRGMETERDKEILVLLYLRSLGLILPLSLHLCVSVSLWLIMEWVCAYCF